MRLPPAWFSHTAADPRAQPCRRTSLAQGRSTYEGGRHQFALRRPLTTAVRRLGAMGFSSLRKEAYSELDVEFLHQVGKQVAVAVDNVLHHQELIHDRDRLRLLLEVTESIALHYDVDRLLHDLAQRLPSIVPFDYINIVLHDPAKEVMRLRLLVTSIPVTIKQGLELPMEESPEVSSGKRRNP